VAAPPLDLSRAGVIVMMTSNLQPRFASTMSTATPTPTQHVFTPAKANKTLPLVRRIVADLLDIGRAVRASAETKKPDWEKAPEVQARMDQLEELMSELHAVGCSFRDWNFEVGLVDFPAVIEGEEVLLCWRSDEDAVTHYHGVHDGYAGRRPIPPQCLDA
jgi:hypothetical protein